MHKRISEQSLFFLMATFGGFLGGYTVTRCGVLASAETVNLIVLTQAIFGLDISQMLIRLGAALTFAFSISLSTVLRRKKKINLQFWAVIADSIGIIIVSFLPESAGFFALYPIFFITGFQWNAFPGACGYASSCVFSTNNYRQLIIGITEYIQTKDQEVLRRTRFFASSLLFFHIGVAAAFFGMRYLGFCSILLCLLLIIPAGFACLTKDAGCKNIQK